MLAAAQPYPQYFDSDGKPLDGGAIYYGTANADPESSPVTVYWDAAGTQPAAQPIPTLAGFPVRAGTPAAVYVSGDYSLRVRNRQGVQVLYTGSAATASQSLSTQLDLASAAAGKGAALVAFKAITGAVARTAHAKLGEVVSVLDFGAVADGNQATGAGTDNSAAFQAAINALGVGGVLYVPGGTYKLGSQITLPSNFTLRGAGNWCAMLFAPPTFNGDGLIKLSGSGGPPTVVEDLCISGQYGGAGAASVGINSAANGTVLRNLWVTSFKTNVILGSSDNMLLDSFVEETMAGGTGVSITSPDVTVANCVVYNCYIGVSVNGASFLDGVVLLSGIRSVACGYTGYLLNASSNIQVIGCSSGHNNLSRYGLAGLSMSGCSNVQVSNFVARIGGGPSTAAYGIQVSACSKVDITAPQCSGWLDGISVTGGSDVSIVGGNVSDNYRRGLYLAGGDGHKATGVTAKNNGSSPSAVDAGIYSDNTDAFGVHSIVGCICTQNGSGPQDYGIAANLTDNAGNSGFTLVADNVALFNGSMDISLSGKPENIRLSGNNCKTSAAAVPTLASSSTITPPIGCDVVAVSGSTTITAIAAAGCARRTITLVFTGTPTVADGGNLKLNGNFVATADDTLTLWCDGASWYEIARSAN